MLKVTDLFACFRLEIICKADDIKNGTKNATRVREGEMLQYTCDPGYVLDGAPVLTCTSSATWDKPKPKCQDGACEYPKENCSPSCKQIYSGNEERAWYDRTIWLSVVYFNPAASVKINYRPGFGLSVCLGLLTSAAHHGMTKILFNSHLRKLLNMGAKFTLMLVQ